MKEKKGKLISVEVECPNGHVVKVESGEGFSSTGGCYGHGEGEYCYCPSPDVLFRFNCPECSKKNKYRGWSEVTVYEGS